MPMRAPRCSGVGRDRERGLRRRLEQEIVEHGLVLVGDVGDRTGQREHDVEVGRGQQLGLAFGEPFLGCRPLTFGQCRLRQEL